MQKKKYLGFVSRAMPQGTAPGGQSKTHYRYGSFRWYQQGMKPAPPQKRRLHLFQVLSEMVSEITSTDFPWEFPTRIRYKKMQTTHNYHKLKPTHIVVNVRPEILIALTIETAIKENRNFFLENPGAIAMIRTLGLTEEILGPTITKALDDTVGKIKDDVRERVQQAERYIASTAMFLEPAGRAWGIFLNACLANADHVALTKGQKQIFGGKDIDPIITSQGVASIFNAMVTTEVDFGDNNKQSLAQVALRQVGNFGSPDNNVIAAILPTAIKTQGKLNPATITPVVKGLRTEEAHPTTNVPRDVVETATEYMATIQNVMPPVLEGSKPTRARA